MKFLGALSRYLKLNHEQRKFVGNAQRSFSSTPAELLEFFRPMAIFDKSCDEARAQLMNCAILFGVLSFLGIIAIGVLSDDMPIVIAIDGFIFLMMIAALLLRWLLGRIDIHNNLRNFVVPLTNLIGQDTVAGHKINLELDLTGKKLASKLKSRTREDPGWFSYPKTTTSIYHDPWFRLTTDLVDGSKLMLSIDDQIKAVDRTYKGMSGKIKSKSKAKVKHMIRASLALKHKKYAVATQSDIRQLGPELKMKDGENRQVFCLKKTIKTDDIEANVYPQVCVELLGRILMAVQPATTKGG